MKKFVRSILYMAALAVCFAVIITCIKVEKKIMVATGTVNNVQSNTATAEGTVVDVGEGVTQHGHVYGTASGVTPGGGNSETRLGAKGSTGNFSSELTGLTAGATYYIRAYVTGSSGTTLGKEVSFKTTDPEVPSLTTTTVRDITTNSATSGGNITADGGAPITERGVCWSTSSGPTTDNSKTTDGTETGIYSSFITGLSPGTTYFLRAYASNRTGTAYGEELSFTTGTEVPTLTTAVAASITATSAESGGNITSNGGSTVTASGVCWSINPGPDISGNHTTDGSTTGIFTSTITGLTPGTTYYVRAYATNSEGTGYGQGEIFVTSAITHVTGSFTDSRDGNPYNWVQIGTKKWMSENLSFLPRVSRSNESSDFDPHYYVYGYQSNDVSAAKATINYATYGVLYNWKAAMAGANSNNDNPGALQGVCPVGWHLPSDNEWKELEVYLGMTQAEADQTTHRGDIGGSLKEEGTTHWSSPNTGATNLSGFTALPGGFRNADNSFYVLTDQGIWWTSSAYNDILAYSRLIDYEFNSVWRGYHNYEIGVSVRCVEGQGISVPVVITTAISGITATTASSGGNVTSDGGSSVTIRGICWSTSPNPVPGNGSETVVAAGTGFYTSNATGLTPNTTYYLRAYATNSAGTTYGNELSFTTSPPATLPIVTTASVSGITATSAFSGGDVQDEGGAAVTAKGVCWSTAANPKVTDPKNVDGTGSGTFTSNITGLNPATTYYIRAYATNSVGTAYGAETYFTTSATVPDAPTIGTATKGDAQVTVTFTAPVSDGGSAIVAYTVTSSPGSVFSTGSASPVTVTGLANGTAYTFTVTATNAIGTSTASAASNSVTPSAVPDAPIIGTATAGDAQATVTFTVPLDDGGSAITGYTVTSNPEGHTATGSASPVTVTGLTNLNAYTFSVVATNINGNSASSAASNSVIPLPPGTILDIDGNIYTTVSIGTQTWMAENLKTTKYNDGTAIQNATIDLQWAALVSGAYCDYDNNPANSTIYGRLYNWYAVDNSAATMIASNGGKNVCPTGWHVPTDAEWTTLTSFLGGEDVAGGKLKETGTTHWTSPNTGATNETGFTALPGGYRSFSGIYGDMGNDGYWWSSTEYNTTDAYSRQMIYYDTRVYRVYGSKQAGFSVRCARD